MMNLMILLPVVGADFLAALVASCFLGALPPVDLRAVCLVLAIFFFTELIREEKTKGIPRGCEMNKS